MTIKKGFRANLPLSSERALARQSRQVLSAQQVKMEMKYRLPALRPGVDDQTVTILADIELLGQMAGSDNHAA
jgi:hypothetical protein